MSSNHHINNLETEKQELIYKCMTQHDSLVRFNQNLILTRCCQSSPNKSGLGFNKSFLFKSKTTFVKA